MLHLLNYVFILSNLLTPKVDMLFNDKMVEFKLVVTTTPEDASFKAFVLEKDKSILATTTNLLEALVNLISCRLLLMYLMSTMCR